MEEPEVIHSQKKHEVSIPEGSHVAVSKTATAQEPSVRKVLRMEGGDVAEQETPDRFEHVQTDEAADRMAHRADVIPPDRTDLAKTHVQSAAAAIGHEPEPASHVHKTASAGSPKVSAPSLSGQESTASTPQALSSSADVSHVTPEVAGHDMPQMDFPARVVHLRIENEKLRTRLENLDSES